MELKRIKRLRVNDYDFKVIWKKDLQGASLDYYSREIVIGVCDFDDEKTLFNKLSHELLEIAMIELNVRLQRPDCETDYIFVFDHRQFTTLVGIYTGLITQFLV